MAVISTDHFPGKKGWYESDQFYAVIFGLCILLLILLRAMIFGTANMVVDSDQPFMWLGASDYSKGHFYEPRFYGQDYNTFLEGLVAVPFIWLKIPVYYAVPLATHLIFLFPFVFTAVYLFSIDKKLQGISVLVMLLCMTTSYDIMTSLPRGFVTGLCFCSFYVISLHHPSKISSLVVNLLLTILGFFVNPNILVVAAPVFIYLWICNLKNKSFYLATFASSLAFVPLYFIFDRFYINHPEYVIYNIVHSYKLIYLIQNINNLDQCFGHLSFFIENNSLPLLAVFFMTGTLLFMWGNRKLFYAFLAFLAILLLSFITGKTREGSHWPYYSYSRMYLGIPLVIGLFASLLPFRSKKLAAALATLCLLFPLYKICNTKKEVSHHIQDKEMIGVHLVKLEVAQDAIKVFRNYCKKYNCPKLVVANIFWLNTFLTYGGPAIYPDFPETEETNSDHRYWVWHDQRDKVYERFMLLSINIDFDNIVRGKYPFEVEEVDGYGLFLIKNNHMRNEDFISIVEKIES